LVNVSGPKWMNPVSSCRCHSTCRAAGTTLAALSTMARALSHAPTGMTVAGCTNFPRSPIATVADIVLTTVVRETTFRPEAIAARHSALVVIDCVYIGVAQRTYPAAEPALTRTSEAVADRRYRT
jgi:DNA-binding MurR/RpiR family transcriptional regulator